MEELNNIDSKTNVNTNSAQLSEEFEEESIFSLSNLYAILILNWKWFVLSVVVCFSCATLYLRYTIPIYQATAKMFVKEGDNNRRSSLSTDKLGMISNSSGIENEMEIISSHSIAVDAVKRLKLYTTYKHEGRIVDNTLYKSQALVVDIDAPSLEKLSQPISMSIKYEGGKYHVTGSYVVVHKGGKGNEARQIDAILPIIPARIRTAVGYLTFMSNSESTSHMREGETLLVTIAPPRSVAYSYMGRLGTSMSKDSRSSSIMVLTFRDEVPERAMDYLRQLAISYNDEANNDKNIVAVRTEEFINSRLEKINAELGMTEGQIESYKRQNRMVSATSNATAAFSQSNSTEDELAEMSTQLALLNSITEYMAMPQNKYQTLPSNVGLTDQAASSLINTYNNICLERQRLLRTANENSPTVIPLTEQLNDLMASIRRALSQARNNFDIRRSALQSRYAKFDSQLQQSPAQERILNEIGRQQEVRSGLYLMLLQKREENSISLAATADKGKLIDEPMFSGKVSPDNNKINLGAIGVGLVAPLIFFLLIQLMRYKIEGRNDVVKLTGLPIIADIPVANESAKTIGDMVVKENSNSMMNEIFRSLRTDVLFTMKEGDKVIMFTSSASGEGKTFITANLAMSFATLEKKVIIVGLDIRKPRLAEQFAINDKKSGITNLLTREHPTVEQVKSQIVNTGVSEYLDIMFAGPIPPNPAELVTRSSLDIVFEILKTEYDYILVDTAPIGLVSDTQSIARVANATLYVCRADFTPKSAFATLNALADNEKLTNVSVVINGVDLSKKKYGYYYGYGRYGRYARYGYGRYSRYGNYGHYGRYGNYGRYGIYGRYGNYSKSSYGKKNDESIKR